MMEKTDPNPINLEKSLLRFDKKANPFFVFSVS
ncbi:MAG: hypothetical protein CNIPEHKO_00149 [Anaerolineales bacterium]|nr:hypothetical protein [Anaerolineales bacterium]